MASPPQRRIGLTGGIASGKSMVGRLLAAKGLPVLDADIYSREALTPGGAGAQAVLDRYGPRVAATGTRTDVIALDRPALGRIVFGNAEERRWLEGLVHPLVQQRFAADLDQHREAPVAVLIIPLLFEAGLEPLCSEVWLVDCEESQQLQRLTGRDQIGETEALERIAAQWPLARKRLLADVVIDNRGSPEALAHQVDQALDSGPEPLR